jgi:hypothetical protein
VVVAVVVGVGGNGLKSSLANQLQTCIYSASPSSKYIFGSIIREQQSSSGCTQRAFVPVTDARFSPL